MSAPDVIDEQLTALNRARQLQQVSRDLQAVADAAQSKADVARRDYERAGGVCRALIGDTNEQVVA